MELHELITKIETLKSDIEALRPIDPDQERRVMQKFRLDWNYHSNAIEGNTLTLGETRAFLLHGLTAKGKPFKDYLDIKGHNETIAYLEQFVRQEQVLTEAYIREIHKILLVEPYEVDAITPTGQPTKRLIAIGQYKTMPNHVKTSTGQMHYYATPEETPAKMGDLMAWYRAAFSKDDLHPLIIAATFHYEFVSIHPFDDGNGRMARLLMNLTLMQAGYVPVVIKVGTKQDYLLALEQADAGELEHFISLIGQELMASMALYLRGARGESIDELGDLDKKITLLQKKLAFDEQTAIDKENAIAQAKITLFNRLIKPFLETLSSQLTKFNALFERSSQRVDFRPIQYSTALGDNDEPLNIILHDLSRNLDTLLNDFSDSGQSDLTMNSIDFTYQLKGFIKNKNYHIDTKIIFELNIDEFTISYKIYDSTMGPGAIIHQGKLLTGNYNDHYAKQEINERVSIVTNQVYNMIEQQANE